jgi:hypothetical protein
MIDFFQLVSNAQLIFSDQIRPMKILNDKIIPISYSDRIGSMAKNIPISC